MQIEIDPRKLGFVPMTEAKKSGATDAQLADLDFLVWRGKRWVRVIDVAALNK